MISRYYGLDNMKVKNLGMKKEFYDRYDAEELLENLGITPEKIMEEAKNIQIRMVPLPDMEEEFKIKFLY